MESVLAPGLLASNLKLQIATQARQGRQAGRAGLWVSNIASHEMEKETLSQPLQSPNLNKPAKFDVHMWHT